MIAIGIYGSGGFAREVMPLARETAARIFASDKVTICFLETTPSSDRINGYPIMAESEFFLLKADARYFNIAIGDSRVREAIAARMIEKGAKVLDLAATNMTVYDRSVIGEGAILCANSVVTSNAQIGRFVHINLNAYVAHDCVVGDFVTLAPNVACNGNVHIGDHAYIGTGAILKQGTSDKPLAIGKGAVVGMGAVVTKNVEPHTTVVGNPARLLMKT